MTKGAIEL